MASVPVRKLSRDAHRQRVHARVRMRVAGTPERPALVRVSFARAHLRAGDRRPHRAHAGFGQFD